MSFNNCLELNAYILYLFYVISNGNGEISFTVHYFVFPISENIIHGNMRKLSGCVTDYHVLDDKHLPKRSVRQIPVNPSTITLYGTINHPLLTNCFSFNVFPVPPL
ncbi:hypothetical protein CEXT_399381 [Caerostris extrusa]|uniref:Uncharacterized protein n=1 Tax=Caerostris extrusa TaxID=172846 RepID=A0AAV4QPR4_CAEEX|nr:hypothetical protein CEXT_399381 [Caerostris extrusa]